MNVTAHIPVASAQLFELNVPDPPVTLKVTVPVGVLIVPGALSATVAVHEVAWPMTGMDGVQATAVVVVRAPTEIGKLPELIG